MWKVVIPQKENWSTMIKWDSTLPSKLWNQSGEMKVVERILAIYQERQKLPRGLRSCCCLKARFAEETAIETNSQSTTCGIPGHLRTKTIRLTFLRRQRCGFSKKIGKTSPPTQSESNGWKRYQFYNVICTVFIYESLAIIALIVD